MCGALHDMLARQCLASRLHDCAGMLKQCFKETETRVPCSRYGEEHLGCPLNGGSLEALRKAAPVRRTIQGTFACTGSIYSWSRV